MGIDTDIEDICENIVKILGNDAELVASGRTFSDIPDHELPLQVIQCLISQKT